MPDIKDTISGPGSEPQDIAMVQMMLKVIKDAKGTPYLKVNYSGEWNIETNDAIIRFQQDNKLIKLPPEEGKVTTTGAPTKAPAVAGAATAFDKTGVVESKSATFRKLNDLLPPDYKDATILPGAKTIYFPGKASEATVSSNKIRSNLQLEAKFRQKVADFIDAFYKRTKIVLKSPPRSGGRRDFKEQMNVISQAGPGESNHQFGQAADIGFQGLKWVDGDGTIREDTYWLNLGTEKPGKKAHMTKEKAKEFWKAHNQLAFGQIGLRPTSLAGDELHVQAYDDLSLSYSRSLAKLLNITSKTHYEGMPHVKGQQNKYKSDFGLGGKTYIVGTSKELFGGEAKININDLTAALNASKKDLAKLHLFKDFQFVKKALNAAGKPPLGKLPEPVMGGKLAAKDICDADIDLLRKAAKADWVKADQNWKQWGPVK
jgi:hypothetical protein